MVALQNETEYSDTARMLREKKKEAKNKPLQTEI